MTALIVAAAVIAFGAYCRFAAWYLRRCFDLGFDYESDPEWERVSDDDRG